MLANAVYPAKKIHWLNGPLREQTHSYRSLCATFISRSMQSICRSELAREGARTASHFLWGRTVSIREQARSHRIVGVLRFRTMPRLVGASLLAMGPGQPAIFSGKDSQPSRASSHRIVGDLRFRTMPRLVGASLLAKGPGQPAVFSGEGQSAFAAASCRSEPLPIRLGRH